MAWDLTWRAWYCLGRQAAPGLAVPLQSFENYLVRYREALPELQGASALYVQQAYLVAGALAGLDVACRYLLALPALSGASLEDSLRSIARRYCPKEADVVVADFLTSWFAGTPQKKQPLLERWVPRGDFTHFCMRSIGRLARACKTIGSAVEMLETVGTRDATPRSTERVQDCSRFVDCFVEPLNERQRLLVAIASQAQITQKEVAEFMGVAQSSVSKDKTFIIDTQSNCLERLGLEESAAQPWWWADVRTVTAEDERISSVIEAFQVGELTR